MILFVVDVIGVIVIGSIYSAEYSFKDRNFVDFVDSFINAPINMQQFFFFEYKISNKLTSSGHIFHQDILKRSKVLDLFELTSLASR